VKGYKGFDNDFQCRGYQFEPGKTYEHDGDARACESGFHFCEFPFDVWGYYPPSDSRFAEVKGTGKTDKHNGDSKVACTKLHVGAEISLNAFVNAGVKFILDRVTSERKETNTGYQSAATNTGYRSAATNTGDRSAATNTGYQSAATNTGDQSAATNTGDQSAATNTGDRSAATNTGYQSAATVEGKESIAMVTGMKGKAKGNKSCWLVLAEWEERKDGWHIKDVKSVAVDGKKIKEDTYYALKDGEFVEAE